MIATSGFLTATECTKFVFGRGCAPNPANGAYDAHPDSLVGWGGETPSPFPLRLGRNLCTHNVSENAFALGLRFRPHCESLHSSPHSLVGWGQETPHSSQYSPLNWGKSILSH